MLSLVLLASMLTTQGPTGPVVKYKFDSKSTTSVDLSAMGQGSQTMEMGVVSWFSVTTSDSAGGRIARVVIDSGKVDAGQLAAMLPDSLLQVKPGSVMLLYVKGSKVTPIGALEGVGMAGAQLLPGIQLIFPNFSPATAKVGATWTDTLKADTTMTLSEGAAAGQGVSVGGKTITAWTVSGLEGDAFVLDATISGTSTVNLMGNDAQGTTTGKQHLIIAKNGATQGGTIETKVAMAMAMAGTTAQIDVLTKATLTLLH